MGKRTAIIALGLISMASLFTAFQQRQLGLSFRSTAEKERLASERLMGDKLQLEKQIGELEKRLVREKEMANGNRSTIADLEQRVKEAKERHRDLEHRARRNDRTQKDLATSEKALGELRGQLANAQGRAEDLERQLAKLQMERDGLIADLADQRNARTMVNNAQLEALRGKKGKLTVVAKRTKQIRMAFDLPEELASAANFKLIAPGGKTYESGEAAISMSIDAAEDEPIAAIDMVEGIPTKRASRVHLKFTPEKKLEPGTYRIDVRSGEHYLSTVLLELR